MTTVSEAVEARNTPIQVSPREVLRTLLDRNATAVGASLPSGYGQDRFIRLLLTAANTNPELFECDPRSFLAAGVAAAQLGLEPNDARGLAYLVPFHDHGAAKVTLIIGYKGMLDLARRSGMVDDVHAFPVFQGDAFTYRLGLEPTLDHVPDPNGDEDPLKLAYVYAVASIGKGRQFVVLSRRQVDKVKNTYARSAMSPWHTFYVEMALKTAIRRLCKWLPQTVELATAIEAEERGLVLSGDLAMPAAIEGHSISPGDVEGEAIEAQVSGDAAGGPASPESMTEVVDPDQLTIDHEISGDEDEASDSHPPESEVAASPQPGGRRRPKQPVEATPSPESLPADESESE